MARDLSAELARGGEFGVHHNVACAGLDGARYGVKVAGRNALRSSGRRRELVAKRNVDNVARVGRAGYCAIASAGAEWSGSGRRRSVPGIGAQEEHNAAIAARAAEVDMRLNNVAAQVAVVELIFNGFVDVVHPGVKGGASVGGLRGDNLISIAVGVDLLHGWGDGHSSNCYHHTGCQEIENSVHTNPPNLRSKPSLLLASFTGEKL